MTGMVNWRRPHRRPATIVAALLLGVWFSGLPVAPALAHGEGESDQASVLVLQALGIIANKPGAMEDITDKVDDALTAPDQEGVDRARVQAAKDAVDNDNMDQARALLQRSLQSAAPMQGATGEETGTTVVHNPLNTRGRLTAGDWVLLALSVLIIVVGGWLALRFRPADSVRALRRQLLTQPGGPTPTSSRR